MYGTFSRLEAFSIFRSRVTEQENEAICAKLLSSLNVPWCCRPVVTGRAGRENRPIGLGRSVLVVDARPAESVATSG